MHANYKLNLYVPRWLFAIPFSLALTLSLLHFMVMLIYVDMPEPIEELSVIPRDLTYEPQPIENRRDPKSVAKPKPQEIPPLPDINPTNESAEITYSVTAATNEKIHFAESFSNYSAMPIAQYQVQAKYPGIAMRREIEGYVDIQFDVNALGKTENINIVGADPEGVFEQAAIDAVKRWRYEPGMENGKPRVYLAIVQRLRFQLEK